MLLGDAGIDNLSIKAAPRTDPELELPFLCAIVHSIISTVTYMVSIVAQVELRKPRGVLAGFPSINEHFFRRRGSPPSRWDPDEILSVQRFSSQMHDAVPIRRLKISTVKYIVTLNLPLRESRSQHYLYDS